MMNILGIDSSGLVASAAVVEDDVLISRMINWLESIPFIIRKHIPRHCFR